ncbi:MAG: GNAT family N-acetyltransferase [Promethearchaeota archaeon]
MPPQTMKSERLEIKPMTIDEAKTFMEYRNDPKNAKFQSWTPDYTLESASSFISEVAQTPFPTKREWNQLAVFLRKQNHNQNSNQDPNQNPNQKQIKNVHIGDIAFKMDSEGTQGEFGFTFSRSYQGKGLATEAVKIFLNHCFTVLNLHRITAITDRENLKSIQLLERLKFRREAHFVENIWFKGHWGDEYLYAMLASEFK